MSVTKRDVTALAYMLNDLDHIPSRVRMFNNMVPWVRKACPSYRIIDFYDRVFGPVDIAMGGRIRWNNVTAQAEATDESSALDSTK